MRVSALTEQITEAQAKILKELLADGRKPETEIAKTLGLTKETVQKNYLQMKKMGIITGATIHINYKSFGYKAVAHVLINVDPEQEDSFVEHLRQMPEVYSFYKRGVKGNLDAVVILKTLEQLHEIKDSIKKSFSILKMKTAIWTDVKEMNDNLAIIPDDAKKIRTVIQEKVKKERTNSQTIAIDKIDQKIADKLAEDGQISMDVLSKELGVSSKTAKRRYEKLKKNGVLKVTIQINPRLIGYQAMCVFFTSTADEKSYSVTDKVSLIPNVISVMKTSGDYDLQIWAMVQNIDQLLYIQEQIGKISGISKIETEILRLSDQWFKWPSPRQYISTF